MKHSKLTLKHSTCLETDIGLASTVVGIYNDVSGLACTIDMKQNTST